ncbi:MAG TPA: cupin domain-containing protein [Solirubrobacterales bacterium]|nr:cupin domain-containing protein [Solirubrobacterales bacterium]
MADVTVKRTEDFEPSFRGGMLKARAGLGVTSFGMQLLRFPPHADRYPEHDHSHDGQEEVYTVLEGRAVLQVGDEEHELEPGVFARVGPNERRKLSTADEAAVILALAGVPGQPFEIVGYTEEGAPDPLAAREG